MWPFSSYPELSLNQVADEYDFIIVGGGTAGAVLANRLSAQETNKVLLIERGPVADNWASRVPLLSSDFASDGSRTRRVLSTLQNNLGRPIELYTGSALGGTSRINQMLYGRGLPAEYDAWRDAGNPGWGWEDMKPYFLKSERALYSCDPSVHNTTGEWCNQSTENDGLAFPGFSYVIEASEYLGLPKIADINSPVHPAIGCGMLHFTRDQNQHRSSTYHAFLPVNLALERASRLHIVTRTEAIELIVNSELKSDKLTVEGVTLKSSITTEQRTVKARKEVILCGGPFGSPHLLMLSGIGPALHLKEKDIAVVKDIPAVGSNLQDHFGVSVAFEVPMSHSLLSLQKRPWIFFIELFKYLVFGTGLLLAPVLQMALFASSTLLDDEGLPKHKKATVKNENESNVLPDIEIMPVSVSSPKYFRTTVHGYYQMAYDSTDCPETNRGVFSFLNVLLHPQSKGTVRLSSANPSDPLVIDPQYLSNPSDYAPLRASLKLTLRLRDRMLKQGYPLKDFGVPDGEDDTSLDKFICKRNRTTYHYSSTCRMGPSNGKEDGGVVDEELFVHGFGNLRIADSSVFPWVLGTHLQAPTVAVAEKCADMILLRDLIS
ncbi:alcohol oxidase [Lentinula raphanica]|uniref:Alcohol oxidase n=1 Tax=Lentinula raphanica TaxID=153919 RepID=A0AA38PI97_9AGAR|nr:alcohol oxidase [Lentinula raphanica]